MPTKKLGRHKTLFIILTAVLSGFSALGILSVINTRSIWADELSTIYKTVELNTPQMINYLRTDAHPPMYYLTLQRWFTFFEPSTTSLRLPSWINYLVGGILMTIQTFQLGRNESNQRAWKAACLGALIVFSSPFALRFSIEGKGYSLMVMLIAAGLLCRQNFLTSNKQCQYRKVYLAGTCISLAFASLTHYYGLFISISIVLADCIKIFMTKGSHQEARVNIFISEIIACLPSIFWAFTNLSHLSSGRGIGWIGKPDYGLFESILANYIGPFPIPKIIILGISLWIFRQNNLISFQQTSPNFIGKYSTLDLAGAPAGALMIFIVIAISFVHPIAYSRYFIVLIPIIAPLSALYIARIKPNNTITLFILLSALALIWTIAQNDTFGAFSTNKYEASANKSSNYRAMSMLTANDTHRFTSNRIGHANTSDLVAKLDNNIKTMPIGSWKSISHSDLNRPNSLPDTMVVAATGRPYEKILVSTVEKLKNNGFTCNIRDNKFTHVKIYDCQRQPLENK